jgi:hypothetical protein
MSLVETKPDGIPQLADFLASDNNFNITRSFGGLHSRVILQLHLEISILETQLNALNRSDVGTTFQYRLHTAEHDDTWDPEQKELIDLIREKLVVYGKFSIDILHKC